MLHITALMDNKPTENKALIAEHGLSLYVEHNGRRILFDCGSGSMVASYANNSYFWVVSQFSDMKTEEAYKCQTGMTAIMGIVIIAILFVLSLFI